MNCDCLCHFEVDETHIGQTFSIGCIHCKNKPDQEPQDFIVVSMNDKGEWELAP